jgi:TonB family protein
MLFHMRRLVPAILLIAIMALPASAQTGKDAEQSFRTALIKHRETLRSYSAESQVHMHWDGAVLSEQLPRVRTFGIITVDSVKLKSNKIEIRGDRRTLLRGASEKLVLSSAVQPVLITIDVAKADIAPLLPRLPDLLFFPTQDAAIAGLPATYRNSMHANISSECCGQPPARNLKDCDCAHSGADTCGTELPQTGMSGLKPPKVLRTVDPEFSEEARRSKFSGNVEVGMQVEATGHTTNFWLAKPAGLGLDEKAVDAVSQYVFAPATCHDQPVPTTLYVSVNFRIF